MCRVFSSGDEFNFFFFQTRKISFENMEGLWKLLEGRTKNNLDLFQICDHAIFFLFIVFVKNGNTLWREFWGDFFSLFVLSVQPPHK